MSCTVAFYFIKGLPSLMDKLISSSRSVLSLWLIEVKMFGHECQKITWKQSKLLKILLSINMYLAKLNVVLSFLNKRERPINSIKRSRILRNFFYVELICKIGSFILFCTEDSFRYSKMLKFQTLILHIISNYILASVTIIILKSQRWCFLGKMGYNFKPLTIYSNNIHHFRLAWF